VSAPSGFTVATSVADVPFALSTASPLTVGGDADGAAAEDDEPEDVDVEAAVVWKVASGPSLTPPALVATTWKW